MLDFNPFNLSQDDANKFIKNFQKNDDKALRNIFGKKIKENFLTEIKYKVLDLLSIDIGKYYNLNFSIEDSISNSKANIDYDICNHIVGLHRSNMVFLSDEEKTKKQKNLEYKNQLAREVLDNVKLRFYGSSFFRNKPIVDGDRFLYFHVPYDLFVICLKMNELLSIHNSKELLYSFCSKISNNGIAALSLLEDNFLDNIYPICRSNIEFYLELLILLDSKEAREQYIEFSMIEIRKTGSGQEYPAEFLDLFNKRIFKKEKMSNFLHFGWLDKIKDYHKKVKNRPYSLYGIIDYLKATYGDDQFKSFDFFYRMCNSYAHGSSFRLAYPLVQYFEISIMLFSTIVPTFKLLCNELNIDPIINDINIISKIEKDFELLYSQYEMKSTEKLREYYKDLK